MNIGLGLGLTVTRGGRNPYGPEEVTNGDGSAAPTAFGAAMAYFQGAGASSGGTWNVNATVAGAGCNARISANAGAIGKRYRIEYDVTAPATVTSFVARQTINGATSTMQTVTTRGAVVRVAYDSAAIVLAGDRPLLIDFQCSNITDPFALDNISIREIL